MIFTDAEERQQQELMTEIEAADRENGSAER